MLVKMTMFFGFVGLTAMASSDSLPDRLLTSTFCGVLLLALAAPPGHTTRMAAMAMMLMTRSVYRMKSSIVGRWVGYYPLAMCQCISLIPGTIPRGARTHLCRPVRGSLAIA